MMARLSLFVVALFSLSINGSAAEPVEAVCISREIDFTNLSDFYTRVTNFGFDDLSTDSNLTAMVDSAMANNTVLVSFLCYDHLYDLRFLAACIEGSNNSCYSVVSFELEHCRSASLCSELNETVPYFTADCSGISVEFPDCQLDCGAGAETCGTPPGPTAEPTMEPTTAGVAGGAEPAAPTSGASKSIQDATVLLVPLLAAAVL